MKNKLVNILILLVGCMIIPMNAFALEKQEVVFTTLNSNGTVKENIVNNHLKYTSKEDIEDETILKNILNISGKEKFIEENGKLTFKAEGKDITYQGTTDKQLPITAEIKYYLDGKEIKKKDILNKKGKVEIVINFKNNSYNEKYGMKTPFVVTLASIIKGDNNTNIEINNGKVVNTGTKNIVVGISTPGLYEDLKIDELKDMDTIKISYETIKFKDSDLYFVATPKMFTNADLKVFDKLDGLDSSMKKLQEGVNSLQEGANRLVDGTGNLSEQLNNAADGSKKITDGLNQINNNTLSISKMTVLVDSLYGKYQENNALLEKINNGTAKSQIEAGINDATTKMNELMEKKAAYDSLKALVDAGIELPEDKQMIYNQLSANIDVINGGISQYKTGIENAQKQLAALPTNKAALVGSNQTIETILENILGVESMNQVPAAIGTFKENTNKLTAGVSELTKGSTELTNGLGLLYDGSKKINAGTTELRDGIVRLNSDGISKLTSLTTKLDNYKEKVDAIVNMSKEYKGYASSNANETVFIYKVSK